MFIQETFVILNGPILYISENLTCLFFGFDLLFKNSIVMASYYDLITDVAEGFGVWIALLILILPSLTLLVVVQQLGTIVSSFGINLAKNKLNKISNTNAYKNFLKIVYTVL